MTLLLLGASLALNVILGYREVRRQIRRKRYYGGKGRSGQYRRPQGQYRRPQGRRPQGRR